MKRISHLLFAVISAAIINSCSKVESANNDANQIDDPLEIKENVLVKKITRTDAQGNIQTADFRYDGNKILSIETGLEKHSFFYSGNLITKREVYNKTDATTEITNYTYNGKALKTMNNITLTGDNSDYLMFKAPDNYAPDSLTMHKYRGFIYFIQGNMFEYITIDENYDLALYGASRPALVNQYNYRYTYDQNKNPFDNIIGMGYLLNNDTRFSEMLHLLNGTCKKNITKLFQYSYLTFWGNPTDITEEGASYTYDRVYKYNDLNYPAEFKETVSQNKSGITTIINSDIVYNYYYY